ncbi:formylglycine-generating enzyme family protein [Protaetiibacter sp. 10F1B-8-1]|uniref:Formylglycine-generating enzyme family protein n=1 Tax=Protaetiibacter mangrovi TaxID=2970926 RepID=A0ABT1ZG76_9MICO|nr:formylglycine-generating enzyme family protein [Protaetiibacter mangrovi]MCS0499702.1 formylglycine-generating enzyme family protein [Protaetiibacter mangrovi]
MPVDESDAATCLVPAGSYLLGDAFEEGYPFDAEGPQHTVELDAFDIDATPVTNAQFARFVEATGHVTDAETAGSSAVFHLAVAAERHHVIGRSPSAPWWLLVAGADWRHPFGPLSDLDELADHPVVHVSWYDAAAYARWAGRALPGEWQWEAAARGGLTGARYAWGDELTPGGHWMCNIWQGTFPSRNTRDDGWLATSPVRSYPANGLGLYDVAGNVWEWCADRFETRAPAASSTGAPLLPIAQPERRVTRGGSYLCHESYCNRYRVAARTGNTPDSTMGNCGFRTVGPRTEAPGDR